MISEDRSLANQLQEDEQDWSKKKFRNWREKKSNRNIFKSFFWFSKSLHLVIKEIHNLMYFRDAVFFLSLSFSSMLWCGFCGFSHMWILETSENQSANLHVK